MSIKIYSVKYTLGLADPEMPQPRYHTVIFAETFPDGSGHIHHVTGDLVDGMSYQRKLGKNPQESQTFHQRIFLGTVPASSYPAQFDQICQSQPPPPKQKSFNIKTMRTEQVKPDGTFYAPGEPRPAMIKCTEWTEQQAIPALYASGILTK
jgi:hypothetical protein